MRDPIIYTLLNRLPQNLVSRSFGAISDLELPAPVQSVVNKGFAAVANIDTAEGEKAPEAYRSLNAFFTRKLKDGVRVVDASSPFEAVSPVDGRLDQFGKIDTGLMIQAKGRQYTSASLLDSYDQGEVFREGSFATLYLSPRDYHRVHSAVGGQITEISYVPGRLWPVKPWAVQNVDDLFAINERLITYIDTKEFGRVASVMVGATCVGRMTLSFSPYKTNGPLRRREEITLGQTIDVVPGDEIGTFNLGSTVILLFEKEVTFESNLDVGVAVRMGERLCHVPSKKTKRKGS